MNPCKPHRCDAIIVKFRKTFSLLQGYDEGFLKEAPQVDQKGVWPIEEARDDLSRLKDILQEAGEATDLFGREREDKFAALWGNLESSVFGSDAYPSIEVRAAHVLYFVVKNHPFADGNKRSGAYLFLAYLDRQGKLVDSNGNFSLNPEGVAALTVLVAESRPSEKDLLIELIVNMLSRGEGDE
jgi:prophage maintenance system killer protein